MKAMCWIALVAACGGSEDRTELPPPIAEIPGAVDRVAVNDTSLFLHESDANTLVELGLDGSEIGELPVAGEVLELAAAGDTVAWVEVEGAGTVIKRRRGGGAIESHRALEGHVIVNDSGVYFSDLGLIAAWGDGNPERIATPDASSSPQLLDVDGGHAYAVGAGSVIQIELGTDMPLTMIEMADAPTMRGGRIAYRTSEGIRVRDLASNVDGVSGFVPGSYSCELLLVDTVVMCGKFRVFGGNAEELLVDPVAGYAARGADVYWVTIEGDVSRLRVIDALALEGQ